MLDFTNLHLLFYFSPEDGQGKTVFFAKPPFTAGDNAGIWNSRFVSWEDVCTHLLELPSEENVCALYQSFMSYVETQVTLISSLVYRKHPTMGLYYDDIIPVRLPYPTDSEAVRWTAFYNMQNSFTLAECLQKEARDVLNEWVIPRGMTNFAIEFAMRHKLTESAALEWYPSVRLYNVQVDDQTLLPQCYAFVSRQFAMSSLQNWFQKDGETTGPMEVVLINRRTLKRQVLWSKSRTEKVYLFVL